MHITGMKIGGIPPFTEPVELEFDRRVNVFIGPNATGKSTLLRGLYSKFDDDKNFALQFSLDWQANAEQIAKSPSGLRKQGWNLVPWVYVSSVRLSLPLSYDAFAMQELNDASTWRNAFRQGGDPSEGRESLFNLAKSNLYGKSLEEYYFDSSIMHVMYGALNNMVRENRADAVMLERMQAAKQISYECAQSICADVLMAGQLPVTYVRDITSEEAQSNVSPVHDDMGIPVSDNRGRNLFLGDLSSGTQGTLSWIWYLAFSMADFLQGSKSWEKQPAILLIDEIENHLHPTWQRRVIPALLDHFPGLQIFATTHSPFVVAGLKAGQVHLLNRDENGVVTASANTENIEGWTADEILRVYMGVHEPTDELTAQAARELRRLRDQPPVTDERGEEERQAEIRRLRQIVNRAELSGPRAAEDARFLADLRSILHRYSQSQNLNQENG